MCYKTFYKSKSLLKSTGHCQALLTLYDIYDPWSNWLTVTNTLAYYTMASKTAVKAFKEQYWSLTGFSNLI